ncbi:hypothetical protein BKA70DRAFT_1310054, partial [Coprinopsis sp. MPI-PUGE-AT-0042]
ISQSKATTTFSSSAPFTPSFSSDPTALYNARVKGRQMLLENPAKESKLKREADRKKELRKIEKAQRQLGIIGRRKRELWSFDKNSINFIVCSPKLLKADFHGAFLIVKNARNPCLVGLQGIIVVTEMIELNFPKTKFYIYLRSPCVFHTARFFQTRSTLPLAPLGIRDESTQGQTVPGSMRSPLPSANQTVTTVPHLNFELYGNQFRFRSTDRAGRKFKHKETIEL